MCIRIMAQNRNALLCIGLQHIHWRNKQPRTYWERHMCARLYFVSPRERPWRQRVVQNNKLVIACVTCVFSRIQKGIPGLTHKWCMMRFAAFILRRAEWRHGRSRDETKVSVYSYGILYIVSCEPIIKCLLIGLYRLIPNCNHAARGFLHLIYSKSRCHGCTPGLQRILWNKYQQLQFI